MSAAKKAKENIDETQVSGKEESASNEKIDDIPDNEEEDGASNEKIDDIPDNEVPEPLNDNPSETEENTEVHDMPDSQMEESDSLNTPSLGGATQSLGGATASVQEEEEEVIDTEFPSTLAGFGYKFNEKGELRNIKTDEEFDFAVKKNHKYNQKRYEALGEVITDHIYQLLEKEGLTRIHLPIDAKSGEPRSFVFATPDISTNKHLLLLIHGAGAVRAGQWARRLIINDNLDSGTQLPYIQRARQNGFAVLVFNTNLNYKEKDGKKQHIRGNEDPVKHGNYVWEKLIPKFTAQHIAIVAHSFGGVVTVEMLSKHLKDIAKKVFAIALTDSVHIMHSAFHGRQKKANKFFKQIAQNWVTSKKPLDTAMEKSSDCPRVSAGTTKHELTSWTAIDSVFKYIEECWNERVKTTKEEL